MNNLIDLSFNNFCYFLFIIAYALFYVTFPYLDEC